MGPLLALSILLLIPMGCMSQGCRAFDPAPSIKEDAPTGTKVTSIILDPNHAVEVNSAKFALNGLDLVLAEEVDYEVEQVIRVSLICRRDGILVPGEDIIVEIINVNDNPPIFNEERYYFTVLEDLPVNSIVGTAIVAEDADKDILYYELISNDTNAATYFRLSSITNPLLVVNKTLDYDLHPYIWLNLTARDTATPFDNPSFTATTLIVIEIQDADDKLPFFQPCEHIGTKICFSSGYTSSVNRSEQAGINTTLVVWDRDNLRYNNCIIPDICDDNTQIQVVHGGHTKTTQPLQLSPGPLYAVDGDYGLNHPIFYRIIGENYNSTFDINIARGNITMSKSVDTLGTIPLQVMAFQTTDDSKYSITTVRIEVKEKNNFPPTFQQPNYFGTIPLNAGLRSFVLDSSDQTKQLQVFAADQDFPGEFNPAVTYRIENSQDFIVLRDGYILTNSVFSSPGNIIFLVTATDSTTSESTTTTVTIEITPILTTTTTTTTTSTSTPTTASTSRGTGSTITTTPSTRTTASTTRGTGNTITTAPSTRTTASTTRGTGTTITTAPSTRTTASTTRGTGTTTTTTPSTRTTASTTRGTGTTTTPSTRTTASTTRGTGTTTTTSPSTRTTASTTRGTGTTITTTSSTRTTASTTRGTGTTTTTTPSTRTTASTTRGTGTTTTTTPSTRTTASTIRGTGTTTTPSTRTTVSTTRGTGTTTTKTPSTWTTASTTKGTGTTIATTPSTRTTASTTKGTGTTTTTTLSTRTTESTTKGTGTTTTSISQTTTSSTTGTGITTMSTNTGTGTTTSTTPGTGSTTKYPGTERALDTYYTANDMAIVGATLGAILVLCMVGLAFLIYKQYGNTIRSKLSKGPGSNSGGSEDRVEKLLNYDDNLSIAIPSNLEFGIDGDITEVSYENNLLSAPVVSTVLTTGAPSGSQLSEEADGESDSEDKKVKSILTKDLKEDGGYKSVWFREDAAPEVMVIEGAENGEANDDDTEGDDDIDIDDHDDHDDDEDNDEDELDPTFSLPNNDSNDFSIL